jgi:hypothetical protein
MKELIKKKQFQLLLLMGLAISIFSCVSECDETVEVYNNDYEVIGWECVTYNN